MANIDTLRTFLNVFNNTALNPDQTVIQLKPLFSADVTVGGKIVSPGVGITDHGPAFYGWDDIEIFFRQLFKTFKDMQWHYPPKAIPGAPMMSDGSNTFGFQIDVTGTFENPWFPSTSTHASPPLSQLKKGNHLHLGKKRGNKEGVPASAVFTFDGSASFLISQIAIYMDRYALMQSITANPGDWTPDAPAYDIIESMVRGAEIIVGGHGGGVTIKIEKH
jgi:hypothetical protein